MIQLPHPLAILVLLSIICLGPAQPAADPGQSKPHAQADELRNPLTATAHPPVPRDPLKVWLAPAEAHQRSGTAVASFSQGVRLHAQARYAEALPLVRVPLTGVLADYGRYYTGLTELRLGRASEAREIFTTLAERPPRGYLAQAVRLRAGEAAEAMGDYRAAAALYAEVAKGTPLAAEDVLMRLASASEQAGDRATAAAAWTRVHYEFPFSDQAAIARAQLDTLQLWQPLERGSQRYALELGRAERLFAVRRYAEARSAFEALQPVASGEAAEVVALRLAESDHYLKRYAQARAALEPWTRRATRRAEAQFFYLTATRETGDHATYERLARALVASWPQESWAEETLNNLATHYILVDEDERAMEVFAEILRAYPLSAHAPRAAWRTGWWAYRKRQFREAARTFEDAAARFPRSDYRPAWLYWAARAHERLGATSQSTARLSLVVTDYQNSYYGRLAEDLLEARGITAPSAVAPASAEPTVATLPPTDTLIRTLIAHELYDDALNEVQYAQKMWGDSPALQATLGLVYSRRGDLRRGINAVKRAYPQYIAAGGDQLPEEMLKVLFPVAYWDLIRAHARARGLDPYVLAALMAQESSFDPGARSHANAIGLMQVVPSTGRRYARKLGIRRFSAAQLTRPEVNVRIGTAIFADLIQRTGGLHYALASYNAGEGAVGRWRAEFPGLPRDEFVDAIPYPETQNYVKKILGTAEDYRRLYGASGAKPAVSKASSATPAKAKVAPKKRAPSKPRNRRRR